MAARLLAVAATLLSLAALSTTTPAQTFEALHTFTGAPSDGEEPLGALVRDPAGNLYGTTGYGGSGVCGESSCGTAFMLNKAGTLTMLYSFGGRDGGFPAAGLFRDHGGNLYGTAGGGEVPPVCRGIGGCGVAFELTTTGVERVYKFQGMPNGEFPNSPLVRDNIGNFYGTTAFGGSYGYGTIFEIDKTGREFVLHSFTGGSDGCFPTSVIAGAGHIYGTAQFGGIGFCNSGNGTVYKLDQNGNFTVLQAFEYPSYPVVSIVDSAGNIYGETQIGGVGCLAGCGTLFKLSDIGNGMWRITWQFDFCSLPSCADGEGPGPIIMDTAGNIYGITYAGGAYPNNCNGNGCGVVYELNTSGEETVLYSFTGGPDGAEPTGGLTMDPSGNLYGVAEQGGNLACNPPIGCGVVFKITP